MKPCPFCGSTDLTIDCQIARMWCRKCLARGPASGVFNPISDGEACRAAAAAWDKRAGEETAAERGLAGGSPAGDAKL